MWGMGPFQLRCLDVYSLHELDILCYYAVYGDFILIFGNSTLCLFTGDYRSGIFLNHWLATARIEQTLLAIMCLICSVSAAYFTAC